MTQYVGNHRAEADQSHTGSMDVESISKVHVTTAGEVIVQLWVVEGFLEEEPSTLQLKFTAAQWQRLAREH